MRHHYQSSQDWVRFGLWWVILVHNLSWRLDDLIKRTLELAVEYKALCIKFSKHLENATELYTFVTHYGMSPTNNKTERALRAFVIQKGLSTYQI